MGIAAPLWTRRAVRDLIRKEFDLELAVRTVGRYLKRWGFTAKRPRRHARDQDPEEVRQWLEETYPAIAARAEREGAEIHWGDEVGVAADQQPARGYAPQGEPATQDVPDPHIRANQISTITNRGEVRFMTYTQSMTAALFLVFLGRLLRSTTGKVFLIVDRLRAHMTPAVQAWVAAHQDRIEVFYLPRYAARVESRRVFEQRPQGPSPCDRLAARQGRGTFAYPGLHAVLASSSRTCHELLPTPIRPICRGHQFVMMLRAGVISACSSKAGTSDRSRRGNPIS